MILRAEYMQQLRDFKDKQVIKVVTGIRRCGKSTLMEMFRDELLAEGVAPEQIIYINFEDIEYIDVTDFKVLYEHIKKRLVSSRKNYIFLDEVQQVEGFERAINSLYIMKNTDIYITGSNAYMLSGELATLLTGRYVEIKMLPLSFKEYVSYWPDNSELGRKYRHYTQYGGFPYILEFGENHKAIREYIGGIYSTAILKDVVARKTINDVSMLESIVRFLFDNIGNICSMKKISDTMTSAGRKISSKTVENYIQALVDGFIVYPARRYDIKGKQYLRTGEKYYLVDMGLRYYLLGDRNADVGYILENIVYLELIRRGYQVYIGKIGEYEVDFIASNDQQLEYYQVAATVRDKKTLERELRSLEEIKDHNPKFLITLDDDPPVSHNGIKQINVLDFLLG